VNDAGDTTLVKFHWKPKLGVHGLVWEEAQMLAGMDPDFHRRDLYNAIGAGAYPQWELGIQVFPDTEDEMFEGIDLLDATKIVPEELAPVQPVGLMTLNRNPTNFFDETEQVAFCVSNVVRGIDVTNDPLMQGRLFSYLDTQLTRLGGPNFAQIPINRPTVAVNDNHRDGFMQQGVHHGRSPYLPNSVGGGCPFLASAAEGGYVHVPQAVDGPKTRERFETDDYEQAALFYRSLTPVEQDHLVNAFRFELGKVDVPGVVTRMLERLANVDTELCELVAVGLGVPAPQGTPVGEVTPSPALQMVRDTAFPVDGRVVQLLVADGGDTAGARTTKEALVAAGLTVHVIAPHKGTVAGSGRRSEIAVDRSFLTASSVEADALVIADAPALVDDPGVLDYVMQAYRHHKTIGAWGSGRTLLESAGVDLTVEGVVVADKASKTFAKSVVTGVAHHRHWDRAPSPRVGVPA
jgi:catalase